MARRLGFVLIAFTIAACAGGEEMRDAFDGVVSCDSETVRVSFDPTAEVEVKAGGTLLVAASFTDRQASKGCEVLRGVPRTTQESTPYDDAALVAGLYRRASFECKVMGGVRIDMHPIFNATIGENDGSSLVVLDGLKIVAAAVLKNEGDPQASRVYRSPRHCTAP